MPLALRAVIAVAALLVAPSVAAAQATAPSSAPLDFTWSAAPGCPDRAALLRELEHLLGRAATVPTARALRVTLTATRDDAGAWRVRVETLDGGVAGERVFDGESCERVSRAAALALAIVIDPTWTPPPPCGAPGEACCAPPAPACDAPDAACAAGVCVARPTPSPRRDAVVRTPRVPRPPRARPRLRALARADGAIDLTALQHPAPGVGGALGLAYGVARVELLGHFWLPQRASYTAIGPTASATTQLASFGVRFCGAATPVPALELGACATGELGGYHAAGAGVSTARQADALWAGAYAGPVAALNFGRYLSLRLSLEAGANLVTPQLQFGAATGRAVTVFQPIAPAGRAALGVEVHFP